MNRILGKLTYANVVATLALFIALAGGTAFAASQLGKESVGTKALKKEAVTPLKLSQKAKSTLTGATGPQGPVGPRGAAGATGPQGQQGLQGTPGIAVGYAYVEENGEVDPSRSLNVTTADVTHPENGDYCFAGLPFTIKSMVASPVNVFPNPIGARVLPELDPKTSPSPCEEGESRVETYNTTNNARTDSAFVVWFEN